MLIWSTLRVHMATTQLSPLQRGKGALFIATPALLSPFANCIIPASQHSVIPSPELWIGSLVLQLNAMHAALVTVCASGKHVFSNATNCSLSLEVAVENHSPFFPCEFPRDNILTQ